MHIAIISASTRLGRRSHRVALYLTEQFTQTHGHTATLLDLAAYNFPIMEQQLRHMENPIPGLREFSDAIKQADAVVFLSPEYNGSYTSALKNALDFLGENEFTRKAVGVCAVSDGPGGAMRAAQLMQQLILGVGGYPVPQMLLVPNVDAKFSEEGQLLDTAFEAKVQFFMRGFLWLAEAVAEKKMSIPA
jgi:NAD(P)H-dependent FMN reductase